MIRASDACVLLSQCLTESYPPVPNLFPFVLDGNEDAVCWDQICVLTLDFRWFEFVQIATRSPCPRDLMKDAKGSICLGNPWGSF